MDWQPYDPAWLVEWARANRPDLPWLAYALARCTRAAQGGRAYLYFVDPGDANQPGAEWQWEQNLAVDHPREGTLVLDILTGRRVGGMEIMRRM